MMTLDLAFLERAGIMDYSLLVGVHRGSRGQEHAAAEGCHRQEEAHDGSPAGGAEGVAAGDKVTCAVACFTGLKCCCVRIKISRVSLVRTWHGCI